MRKFNFSDDQKKEMVKWRKTNIASDKNGFQNGKDYDHIIPKTGINAHFQDVLHKSIAKILPIYLKENGIHPHTGTHNLVSSWVLAANLYFPIRNNKVLQNLMVEFLKKKVSDQITELTNIELEFAFPQNNPSHPSQLLGESDGSRGSGQTSPDVAFLVKTKQGKGLVLTECKYTEHSFYGCSARKIDKQKNRINNPYPGRCIQKINDCDYKSVCHQTIWGRKYLSLINFSEFGKTILKRCPAATAGYQLLRQQALAEGIAQSGQYSLVASSVAFDNRNVDLRHCLNTTGITDFQTEWAGIFDGMAIFKTWTHQEWVQFVRDNQSNGEHNDWLGYMEARYGY
jgi:hypothetical protein